MTRITVIIVAAGSGTRMGADVPKQYLPLAGEPILVRTVRRMGELLPGANIVVVVSPAELFRWSRMAQEYGLPSHEVCTGGDTRFASVGNALRTVSDTDIIMVHDGVRPLVSRELIDRVLATALEHGTAVPAVEPVDSFRIVDGGGSKPFDRSLLRAVQTPQAFRAEILQKAYAEPYDPSFTDDASVVERGGVAVALCPGDPSNIKITRPDDLPVAEALFEHMK